ncbi:hypothetical protein [Rubrivirga sp.]|uniref:hypothetical protein n=1 Tax=Rubrivirga sp. TaxID=1885344 RepID=UPI003C786928
MSNELINTLLLSVLLAAAGGGGYFVTVKEQPEELAAIESEIEAIEAREADVASLMLLEAQASSEAQETLARWNTRYKVLPTSLESADVVSYLNALSARGFQRFDLSLSGITPDAAASYYTYQVTGQAYFESLFAFIWHVENSRGLYRVRDLTVKKDVTTVSAPGAEGPGRQVILAEFAFAVDAFFSTDPEISAPEDGVVPPPEAFPARRAAINPFFPFILESLPPNTDDLVEPETDQLVSIIGRTAVFDRGGELRQLQPGDRVYLGRVGGVDPRNGRVVVDYNRGGIRERVEIDLETGERYRQAIGNQVLVPSTGGRVPPGPVLEEAPPAPGTPEADAAGTYSAEPLEGSYQPANVLPRVPTHD